MEYFTNHIFCTNSCWNDETFFGGVIVTINQKLDTYSIDKYKNKISNPDWDNLIVYESLFNEEHYKTTLEMLERMLEKINKDKKMSEEEKEEIKLKCYTKIPMIKQEIIDWLNVNIQDKKNIKENTPLSEKKSWSIYSKEALIDESKNKFQIFFSRQIDALRFIKEFSIFEKPTTYFDYFSDIHSEMNIESIINILKDKCSIELEKKDLILNNPSLNDGFIKDLKSYDFKILDWERNESSLSKKEVKKLVDTYLKY